MKKSFIVIITLVFSLSNTVVLASNYSAEENSIQPVNNLAKENNNTSTASVHYINAPRFVRPLLEKWIEEYKKVAPQANFAIAKTAANRQNSTLNIQLTDKNSHNDVARKTFYFGSYAILPVTAKNSEAAKVLSNQELNTKKIKSIYFENDDLEDDTKASGKKKNSKLTVYTGNSNQSVAQSFAAHYGKDVSSFKGKRIVGDDQFLNSAIANDPQGITFNALGNIYDLGTRKLKDNLTLLSLAVNKNQREALGENSTLDDLIRVLENEKDSEIPVAKVGISYSNDDVVAVQFVAWIEAEGERYNHQFGLLK